MQRILAPGPVPTHRPRGRKLIASKDDYEVVLADDE
jgi:hypothetical protein